MAQQTLRLAPLTRRHFLAASSALAVSTGAGVACRRVEKPKALIAITLDLEMSREYPQRGMTEWDYEKGNLDEPTKRYAVEAGKIVKEAGGVLHFFALGRTLEQKDVSWLKGLSDAGHPLGNHTYDHVNVLARTATATQFRFQRAPWLVQDKTSEQVVRENIALTTTAMKKRLGITPNGFRTPGGFAEGLRERPDVQRLLLEAGFRWVSGLYPTHLTGKPKEQPNDEVLDSIVTAQRAAQPFVYPSGLIEVPMSPISDVGAFRSNFWKLDWFLTAIGRAVDWAIETGSTFDFLAHPSCLVVEDPKHETIRMICRRVKAAGDRAAIVDLEAFAVRAKEHAAAKEKNDA